jgi:hypothetical protein
MSCIEFEVSGAKAQTSKPYDMKEEMSKKTKARIIIHELLRDKEKDSIAVNMTFINVTSTPFSLLELIIEDWESTEVHENFAYPLWVNKCSYDISNYPPIMLNLDTDTGKFSYDIGLTEVYALKAFNPYVYFMPNQAETGWVIFRGDRIHNYFTDIFARITSTDEKLCIYIPDGDD